MKIKVLKLGKRLFDEEAAKVVLPAAKGEMCILPNHMPIITILQKGVVKIFKHDAKPPEIIEVYNGICSFSKNVATFLLYGED